MLNSGSCKTKIGGMRGLAERGERCILAVSNSCN